MSLDPKGYMYSGMSGYSAFGNNPVLIQDPGGDTLRVYGATVDIDNFVSFIENEFDNEITVKFSSKGFMSLHGDESQLNSRQTNIYIILQEVINDDRGITGIGILSEEDSHKAVGGGWQGYTGGGKRINSIDMKDVQNMSDKYFTGMGVVVHEIWETYQDQRGGKNEFREAHEEALQMQGIVDNVVVKNNYRTPVDPDKGHWEIRSLVTTASGVHLTIKGDLIKGDWGNFEVMEGWIMPNEQGVEQDIAPKE